MRYTNPRLLNYFTLPTLKDHMKNDLLYAVYVDLKQKRRRSKNIIISGLPIAADDREGPESFLKGEFHEVASSLQVTASRRLGRQQTDRVQPLLVICSTVDDAQFILNNCRRLRKPINSLARNQISILIVVGTCTRPCVAAKPPCEPRPAACRGPRPAATRRSRVMSRQSRARQSRV